MNRKIKQVLFLSIIIGVSISVGVGASKLYNSNQIEYVSGDSKIDVATVQDALNDLYTKTNNSTAIIYLGTGVFNINGVH